MVTYEYPNKSTAPNWATFEDDVLVSGIYKGIIDSEMTDKNTAGFRWDKDTEILYLFWQDTLSPGDKTILDGIVADNT